jgi:hypothetical protein
MKRPPLKSKKRYDNYDPPRRSRDVPTSTGRRLRRTERDLMWAEKLHVHGDLPSPILHQFTQDLSGCASKDVAGRRLSKLTHESNTPYGGPLFTRPPQQEETRYALSNFQVYRNTKRADDLLKAHGLYHDLTPPSSSSFWHDLLRSCVTASIALSSPEGFIPHYEVAKRVGSSTIEWGTGSVTPDAMFGIRDEDGTVRCFLLEVDKGTERNTSSNPNVQSIEKKLSLYRELIGGRRYHDIFNMKSGLMVIFLTINEGRMRNFIKLVDDNNYMLFKNIPDYQYHIKPPTYMPYLFTEPYLRAGREPFYINQ